MEKKTTVTSIHYNDAEPEFYKNGCMNLQLIAMYIHNGKSVCVFARINSNGAIHDYIIGNECSFDGNNVTWNYGHYDYTEQYSAEAKAFELAKNF